MQDAQEMTNCKMIFVQIELDLLFDLYHRSVSGIRGIYRLAEKRLQLPQFLLLVYCFSIAETFAPLGLREIEIGNLFETRLRMDQVLYSSEYTNKLSYCIRRRVSSRRSISSVSIFLSPSDFTRHPI